MQCFLKLPHQIFPLLDLRVLPVGLRLFLEGKTLIDSQNHEHSSSVHIDFQIKNASVFDAPGNLRPNLFVVALVLVDELRVVPEIQRQSEASAHASAPSLFAETLPIAGAEAGL